MGRRDLALGDDWPVEGTRNRLPGRRRRGAAQADDGVRLAGKRDEEQALCASRSMEETRRKGWGAASGDQSRRRKGWGCGARSRDEVGDDKRWVRIR